MRKIVFLFLIILFQCSCTQGINIDKLIKQKSVYIEGNENIGYCIGISNSKNNLNINVESILSIKNQVVSLVISSQSINGQDFKIVTLFRNIIKLDVSYTQFTDTESKFLCELGNLKILRLNECLVTGETLKIISNITTLEQIELYGTNISDEDLKYLLKLPNLRSLYLGKTKITDNGLRMLSRLRNLEWLCIEENNITDTGVQYLKGMKKLEVIQLWKTHVSRKMAEELREALYTPEKNDFNIIIDEPIDPAPPFQGTM